MSVDICKDCAVYSELARKLISRFESLEAKCAWQAEMLERAKDIINESEAPSRAIRWFSDLKKGPQ
jgi:hypothetical protein